MLTTALSGFSTGLMLQLAIGPVFFFIFNLSLRKTMLDGLSAVLAVTLVDYIYITLAILGTGKLLQNTRVKKISGIIGSIVLAIFGVMVLYSIMKTSKINVADASSQSDCFNSFISAFILTISSPMTIVFWTSLFTSITIEKNFKRNELIVFGLSTGSATFIFLGSSSILFSIIKASIPVMAISILNAAVGIILIIYGIIRFIKIMSEKNELWN